MKQQLRFLMALLMVTLFGGASFGQETVTDELTNEVLGVTTTTYTVFSEKKATSTAEYTGLISAAKTTGSIQMKWDTSNHACILTSKSGGVAKSITVNFNSGNSKSRIVEFYGKKTAFNKVTSNLNNEFDGLDKLGSFTASGGTESYTYKFPENEDYEFVGIKAGSSSAAKIDKISIVWQKKETSDTPLLSVSANSLDFSSIENNTTKALTFNLSGSNLSADASLAISGDGASMFSVSPTSVTQTDGSIAETPITVTYSPTADGSHAATLTISSDGAENKVVSLTGTATAPRVSHSVTWMVNGQSYTVGNPSVSVSEGEKVATLPTAPEAIDDKYFVGWTNAVLSSSQDEKPSVLFTSVANAPEVNADATYYAVFASRSGDGEVTYTKLTSNNFDPTATYVLGAEQASANATVWYFNDYEGNVESDVSWGKMTSTPETGQPITFTLSGTADALVAKDNSGNYLTPLTTAKFRMSATQRTVVLKGDGTIYNPSSTSYKLRHNYNNGNGGLRWYNGTTGTSAYFYEVSVGYTYSDYTTSVVKRTLQSIVVSGAPTKLVYDAGEPLETEGLVVTGTYDDNTSSVISKDITWTITPATLTVGTTSCTVKATVGNITSDEHTVNGLTVNAVKQKPTITFVEAPKECLAVGEKDMFEVRYDGDGQLTVAPSVMDVAEVSIEEKSVYVKANKAGSVTVTVSASETAAYQAATQSYVLNVVAAGIKGAREQITSISSSNKQKFTTKLTNAVVTYIGKSTNIPTIYVEDADAGVVIYAKDTDLEVGDVISGVISGEGYIYQGLTELTTVDLTKATIAKNGTVPCSEVTIKELNENMGKWESRRVKITNLNITEVMNSRNAVVAQGEQTLNVYEKVSGCSEDALSDVSTKVISIVGYPQDYTVNNVTTNQICVWNKSDITYTEYVTIPIVSACTDGSLYYSTYSSSKPFYVSGDVEVSEITVKNGKLQVESYKTGDIVPARTGVLVAALEGTSYQMEVPTSEMAALATSVLGTANMLKPTNEEALTAEAMETANANCLFYRLTMHKVTQIGFWWGAADGAAFGINANKAYLAVPKELQTAKTNLWIGDEATGITDVTVSKSSDKLYNLNGQRIQMPIRGQLYIKNGKAFVAK